MLRFITLWVAFLAAFLGALVAGCQGTVCSDGDANCQQAAEEIEESTSSALTLSSAAPGYPPPGLQNLAYNPSCSGYPTVAESDQTWGCSNQCDTLDGYHSYDSWCHGHAFTGGHYDASGGAPWVEPAGPRHWVVNFGREVSFQQAVLWWHGAEHTPAEGVLEYSTAGGPWVPIANVQRTYGTTEEPGSNGGGSTSDTYTFAPVTGSKFRYTFDNSGYNVLGSYNVHGWLYEGEIFGREGCLPNQPITVSLHSSFDVLLSTVKPYRIGLEDVYPIFTTRDLPSPQPGVTCHLESRDNLRTMFVGPRLPWPGPGQLPTPLPIGTVAPDVDLDFYAQGALSVTPPLCQFPAGVDNGCLLNVPSTNPEFVHWSTPGFRLNIMGVSAKLPKRDFWVDLRAIPGIAPNAALSVTVDAVEDVVEREIAANIPYAQSRWAYFAEPPLNLSVTDPIGRRTGLLEEGTSLSEIPGSTHAELGDSALVLLYQPENGTYSTRIVGALGEEFLLAVGTADFRKSELRPTLREWSASGTTDTSGPTFSVTLGDDSLVVVSPGVPPQFSLRAIPARLEPTGRLESVRIHVSLDRGDDGAKVFLKSVTCDDDCVPARDIAGATIDSDDRDVRLRATNNSGRLGRTYTLTYEATNRTGASTRKDVSVVVRNAHQHSHCQPSTAAGKPPSRPR